MFEEKTVFDVKRELDAGDPGGLSDREAKQRLSIYGKNELQEKKPPSVLKRLIGQFMDPLIYVLLAAGVISVLLGEQGDAAIIAELLVLFQLGVPPYCCSTTPMNGRLRYFWS